MTVFADQLKNTSRNSDIIARLGGDEFVVLLANHAKETTERTIARLRQSLENINREAHRGYDISFSYGTVEFNPNVHSTIETLLSEGDKLMYKEKKSRQ